MLPDWVEWVKSAVEVFGVGIAAGALAYSAIQLKHTNRQVEIAAATLGDLTRQAEMSSLMAVIELENALSGSKARVSDICLAIEEEINASGVASPTLEKVYEEAKEQWLNFTDRLCSCIIRGYVKEALYKADYQDMVNTVVRNYPNKFAAGSQYQNIIDVQSAWSRNESAVKRTP